MQKSSRLYVENSLLTIKYHEIMWDTLLWLEVIFNGFYQRKYLLAKKDMIYGSDIAHFLCYGKLISIHTYQFQMIYGRNRIQTRKGIILSHASVYIHVICNQISFISPIIFRKRNVTMMIWFHTAMHYTLLHMLPWACTKKIMPKYTSDHTCNVNYLSRNSIWCVKYSVYDGIAVNGRYKFHTIQCHISTIYIYMICMRNFQYMHYLKPISAICCVHKTVKAQSNFTKKHVL